MRNALRHACGLKGFRRRQWAASLEERIARLKRLKCEHEMARKQREKNLNDIWNQGKRVSAHKRVYVWGSVKSAREKLQTEDTTNVQKVRHDWLYIPKTQTQTRGNKIKPSFVKWTQRDENPNGNDGKWQIVGGRRQRGDPDPDCSFVPDWTRSVYVLGSQLQTPARDVSAFLRAWRLIITVSDAQSQFVGGKTESRRQKTLWINSIIVRSI